PIRRFGAFSAGRRSAGTPVTESPAGVLTLAIDRLQTPQRWWTRACEPATVRGTTRGRRLTLQQGVDLLVHDRQRLFSGLLAVEDEIGVVVHDLLDLGVLRRHRQRLRELQL